MKTIIEKDKKTKLTDMFGLKAGYSIYGFITFILKPGVKLKKRRLLCELDKKYGSGITNRRKWKLSFRHWIRLSNSENIERIMKGFYEDELELIKDIDSDVPDDPDIPTVIGVIKNEIIRIPELLSYHRELGVKRFVFIDNGSSDGTIEYLKDQKDTIVYQTAADFYHKLGWVNRAIDRCGINRWYLMLDSDEFLVYPEMEQKKLPGYIADLKKKNIKRVRGFMLNMYPRENLKSIDCDPAKFRQYYRYYDADCDSYVFYDNLKRLCGGQLKRTTGSNYAIISKTPLFYADDDLIIMTAHENHPQYEDIGSKFGLALLHYKFLPGEEQRTREGARSGVYNNDSAMYKQYEKLYDNEGQSLYFEGSHEWTGVECLREFKLIESISD